MHETEIFPLPLLNLTSPSCSSTPISFRTRKIPRFGHKWGLYCIFFIAHARDGCISTSVSCFPAYRSYSTRGPYRRCITRSSASRTSCCTWWRSTSRRPWYSASPPSATSPCVIRSTRSDCAGPAGHDGSSSPWRSVAPCSPLYRYAVQVLVIVIDTGNYRVVRGSSFFYPTQSMGRPNEWTSPNQYPIIIFIFNSPRKVEKNNIQ